VTAIDMRRRLGAPPAAADAAPLAVGIDHEGEAFALMVDRAGDVLDFADSELEPPPTTLDRTWAGIVTGVLRLDGRLMLVLDVDHALGEAATPLAA
jgi:purine-binding chemotaxis protein CheW